MVVLNPLQRWIATADRRLYAVVVGAAIGGSGAIIGLLIALLDPVLAAGVIIGTLIGLYVLTDMMAALYGVIAIMALLPFGTFPFDVGITPTLLDGAMGAFIVVYVFQWMTGRRRAVQLTPAHAPLAVYIGWLMVSFILGLRYAPPTQTILRQFAETILSIGMVFILTDLLRESRSLRRLVLVVMAAVGVQALVSLALYGLPDAAAEWTLVRLARIGYPNGGVIRYIEDNPASAERAIGTWVDPNALGGFLAISAAMIAPQVFANRPVLRRRWIAWVILGVVSLALILTFSRAAMLAFGISLLFIGSFKGYRRFWTLVALGACLLLVLPQTRDYIDRFVQAFTVSDLATQMRVGEYRDSLRLISRYPLTGVGFTGVPDNDLYTGAASMYFIMANHIGLVGVAIFGITIGSVFWYGRRAWRSAEADDDLRPIIIGYHAALLAALINATSDHYYFRIDFHASVTLFWLVVALAVSSSRLAIARPSGSAAMNQPL
ncbi:MAG: O-antigen ligase family protein [Anaerolineae bacterium]|nr:O-antigen ligase family protein [Anaerolineae bacterium]NUQ02377.1 O-antigen ligase family protein [Anaerolineae bacterium]